MKLLLTFEEFLKMGIITRRTPEFPRSAFLVKESERKNKSLSWMVDKIGICELNAHEIIENCYDILIYLIRAKLCKDGFGSGGEGAHEAEVSYMRNLGFSEYEVDFMNQLRYFRNGIKYYGTILTIEYAEKALKFLNKLYPKLL